MDKTGEKDSKLLESIQLPDYNPKYDEDYLNKLISKAKKNWEGIDKDEWLLNLRGTYEG